MTGDGPRHGGQLLPISKRYNIPVSELLDFSANINPAGPPTAVFAALQQNIGEVATLTTYPDLEQTALKLAIGAYAGVAAEALVVANGFVPLLQATLRCLGVRHCILPLPAFGEYRRSLMQCGVQVTPHILSADSGFAYDFDSMLTGGHDAVLLANPQNPSGAITSRAELHEFVAAAATRNIFVLLDEAFIDYTPGHSLVDLVRRYENLIVFRSVTKFFAVPGLRVAYAAMRPRTALSVSEHLTPWPISTLASCAVAVAVADVEFARVSRSDNERLRTSLNAAIQLLGIHAYPSSANFLLLGLPRRTSAHTVCERALLRDRVVLRNCSNFEGLTSGHVRVAVRSNAENALLVEALRDDR
jgi:threonine-phosphate decarboxylase